MQHELYTLQNHRLLTEDYYFVLPFSFLLFSFQFVDQDVLSYRTWRLPDSLYYRSFYVLDLYRGGRFVTKHLILWALLYDFK